MNPEQIPPQQFSPQQDSPQQFSSQLNPNLIKLISLASVDLQNYIHSLQYALKISNENANNYGYQLKYC